MTHPGTMPAAAWFLYGEDGRPLGQVYRGLDGAAPIAGERVACGEPLGAAEVVSFEELSATCALRRWRVVVRLLG